MTRPAAMVVVPTHDHASTLGCAVRSVLEQSVVALDVVIVGDGVGDDTRDIVTELQREDNRVRFIDALKGDSRNEVVRHQVVVASKAPVITYVGDDDLLLPDHVEEMMSLLSTHDFAHPFPVVVDGAGELIAIPTDLSLDSCVRWHMRPRRNTVSLTGASHTLELYRRLPFGWRPAPAGQWSDHHMWEQIFSVPGVRLATSPRATFIKLGADHRVGMSADDRRVEIEFWRDRSRHRGFRTLWDSAVNDAVRRSAVETYRRVDDMTDALKAEAARAATCAEEHDSLLQQLGAERKTATRLRADLDRAEHEHQLVTSTLTWRLRDRVLRNRMVQRVWARLRHGG